MHSHNHAIELSLGVSFVLGVLHALEPGHGKSALFVYMLQQRKSFWHPIVMGFSTGISHAASLLVIALTVHLGVHLLSGDEHAGHQHAGEALQWISSILLVGIGVRLLWLAWRGKIVGKTCSCCRDGNPISNQPARSGEIPLLPVLPHLSVQIDDREGNKGLIHAANLSDSVKTGSSGCVTRARPESASMRMTILLGVAVGLLPCPTALAAYFAGVSSGNPVQGYLVIGVFSAGISLSLILCGFLFQFIGSFFRHVHGNRISPKIFAYIQATAIILIGTFYLSQLIVGSTF